MGKFKETRDLILHIRISQSEMDLLLTLLELKKKTSKNFISKADIVIDALKFADGQINYK